MIEWVYRHARPVRLWHWLNALCLFVLIMSGLQIFNAHQALYWGDRSDRDRPWLSIRAGRDGAGQITGVTTIGGLSVHTTGVLGVSNETMRAFPAWATIPSGRWLAMGRRWHLFFAWVFVINALLFAGYGLLGRHFRRDLVPRMQDFRGFGRVLVQHLTFRHAGEDARRYNVLQKLAYSGVLFGLLPLIVLTGLSMSPAIDAAYPWLPALFGGRQSARSIHFLVCWAFVGFIAVHLLMVATTGLRNNIRSMITGWFTVKTEAGHET